MRWKLEIKSFKKVRTAIDKESAEDVLEALIEVLEEMNIHPLLDDFERNNINEILIEAKNLKSEFDDGDIEDYKMDGMVDAVLANVYDLADLYNIFLSI